MPEITPLGWAHTIFGAVAIIAGIIALYKHHEITFANASGKIYLATTLVTAVTALGIYQRGEFGPGHALAVMTLLALAVGTVAAKTRVFKGWSRYIQAAAFTGTLLFHSIPAITDGLLRLPVGDPVLTSLNDPVFKVAYAILLALYLIGLFLQIRWLRRQG